MVIGSIDAAPVDINMARFRRGSVSTAGFIQPKSAFIELSNDEAEPETIVTIPEDESVEHETE